MATADLPAALPTDHAVLVVAPQWIGDAVMAEPLLRRLARRGARITAAALPWVAPVLRAMPAVAEVVEMPFRRGALQWRERQALARSLSGRFERAFVLPNSFKSALLPWMAGIPERIGYRGEARLGLLTRRLPNPRPMPSMVAFYLALSGEPGPFDPLGTDRPRLRVADARRAAVLAQHGQAAGGYWVCAPGAEYGPAKRWPAGHFAALARALAAGQSDAAPVLLLGSASDADACAAIAAQAPGLCHNLAGRTTLEEAVALIAGARAVVSNDSGLMHVAAALGVPQVAVFGSSSPRHTPPLSPHAQVLWLKDDPGYQPPLDCAPCFDRACRFGHARCLADIGPQRVLAALQAAAAGRTV